MVRRRAGWIALWCMLLWGVASGCTVNLPAAVVPEPLPVQRQEGQVEGTLFPLPVIATDPNSGTDYGLLPVLLFPRDDQAVGLILAPSVVYNDLDKANFAFRLLAYPAEGHHYRLTSHQSTGDNAFHELAYVRDTRQARDWGYACRVYYDADISPRFYGFGNTSNEDDETSYTYRRTGGQVSLSHRLTDHLEVSWSEDLHSTHLSNKHLPNLPATIDLFPAAMEDRRTTTFAHRLTLGYDTRDFKETATCGLAAQVYGETALKTLGSDASFDRVGVEIRGFQPWDADHRFVTAVRVAGELLTRQEGTPFFEWPMLGGFASHRGFGDGRFVDRNMVCFSLEQRFEVFRLNMYNVTSHWEVAPFMDVGKVFATPGSFNLAKLHTAGGIALRAVVRPQVVGHVEVGVSREGSAIFMGLGYPF